MLTCLLTWCTFKLAGQITDLSFPIFFLINSTGGSVTAGLAIYDTMQVGILHSLKLPCKDLKSVSYFSFNSFGTKYPSDNNVFMFPVGDGIAISSWSSKPQIGVIFYHWNS